jgi:endonuclease-3 related protein
MFATPTAELRRSLLELNGIGPESADAILLYAGHHESFVVDAYARRILQRHGIVPPHASYADIHQLVQLSLQEERPVSAPAPLKIEEPHPSIHEPSAMSMASRTRLAQVYNEMHGLMVQVGKHYCLKRVARCEICPLGSMLKKPPLDLD